MLGALSRARQWRAAARRGGGIEDILGGAVDQMQQRKPGLGGLLGGLLDRDGDGSMIDDLLERGLGGGSAPRAQPRAGNDDDLLGGLLGGLLGTRR